MLRKIFLDHPKTVGESYGEHLLHAWGFAASMLMGGLACLAHGLVPCLFEKTGSNAVRDLHDRMVTNRMRKDRVAPKPAEGAAETA
ncbi:MAG: DUF6356 family protein [Caulobacterales bacterium]|nr:DUF6356 family protein [Caulobacterales bacterium]